MGDGDGLESVLYFCIDIQWEEGKEMTEKKCDDDSAPCEIKENEQRTEYRSPYHYKCMAMRQRVEAPAEY